MEMHDISSLLLLTAILIVGYTELKWRRDYHWYTKAVGYDSYCLLLAERKRKVFKRRCIVFGILVSIVTALIALQSSPIITALVGTFSAMQIVGYWFDY